MRLLLMYIAFALSVAPASARDCVKNVTPEVVPQSYALQADHAIEITLPEISFMIPGEGIDNSLHVSGLKVRLEQVGGDVQFTVFGGSTNAEASHAWVGDGTLYIVPISGDHPVATTNVKWEAKGKGGNGNPTPPAPIATLIGGASLSSIDRIMVSGNRGWLTLDDDSYRNKTMFTSICF